MNQLISSKYLFNHLIIEYMKTCNNPKEFHLIRQVSRAFASIIDPNFMRIKYNFSIIGDNNDIQYIFQNCKFSNSSKTFSLYRHSITSRYIIGSWSDNIGLDHNYIHICDKFITHWESSASSWGLPILQYIHQNALEHFDSNIVIKKIFSSWMEHVSCKLCRSSFEKVIRNIHEDNNKEEPEYINNNNNIQVDFYNKAIIHKNINDVNKLRVAKDIFTNNDSKIQKIEKNKYNNNRKNNHNYRYPSVTKRPKTIKYHR